MIGHNRQVKRLVRGHFYLLSKGRDKEVGIFKVKRVLRFSSNLAQTRTTWNFKRLASSSSFRWTISLWRIDSWDIVELRLEDLSAYLGLGYVSDEMHRVFTDAPVRRRAKVATARRLQCAQS